MAGGVERAAGWNRALPLLALAVALVAALVLLVPGARHQAALSLTREPTSYVEFSFLEPDEQRSCPREGGRVRLSMVVQQHHVPGPLHWVAVVTPTAAGNQRTFHISGETGADPEARTVFRRLVLTPSTRPYSVSIRIDDRPERLFLYCAAPPVDATSSPARTAR